MKTISLILDDEIYTSWLEYAKQAGLPLESLILEATRFSIKTDRLGVDSARVQELLRITREAEINSRLKKVTQPSGGHSDTKKVTQSLVSHSDNSLSDDDLPVANMQHIHDDDTHTVNMADLEEAVDRHI